MIYNIALVLLIAVVGWAIFSPKVKDKFGIIIALLMVEVSAMAMLSQSFSGWYVNERANQIMVCGVSFFALRCFYIKSGLKSDLKRWMRIRKHGG